jgi:hypothetical protein
MQVGFTDTFFESFKKIVIRERWYWKLWDTIRYDIPAFFKNLWLFRKALWNYRWYDWTPSLNMFKTGLQITHDNISKKGIEEETSKFKKLQKIKRTTEIMQHFIDDDFVDLAEKELGKMIHREWKFEPCEDDPELSALVDDYTPEENKHNSNVINRSREIEEQYFNELLETLRGQDYSKFKEYKGDDHDKSHDYWLEQFDGSGIRGWWD